MSTRLERYESTFDPNAREWLSGFIADKRRKDKVVKRRNNNLKRYAHGNDKSERYYRIRDSYERFERMNDYFDDSEN